MEQVDREAIQRNIVLLSSLVDIDILYRELIQRGVIDQSFIERIKVRYKVGQEQAQEFFLNYTKRGPLAFQILIESLEKIGHISEATILRQGQRYSNENGSSTGHAGLSPTSSNSPGSSTSLPSSPLMRNHNHMSRVEPLSGTNSPTSSSSSISAVDHQLRRVSVSSNSFEDQPPLVIRVRKAETYNMGRDITKAYQMMSNPRGYALIINNIEFICDPRAKREGAEKDTSHLQQLLEQFGFQCMIRHNVKKEELIDPENGILKKFLDQFKRGKPVDACVVAIMSHGKQGNFIRTHDHEDHRDLRKNHWNFYDEIVKKFNNRYCPVLKGKPKIFILQACQGEERDRGVRRTCTDGRDLSNTEIANGGGFGDWAVREEQTDDIPETEDMIVCYSTVPGYVSNRDIEHGTWYIYTLCKVFMEHAYNSELFELLRMVGLKMRELRSETSEKQMSTFTSLGLHYDLFFNPGLYENSGIIRRESNGHRYNEEDRDEVSQ